MFGNLTERLTGAVRDLLGRGRLTEANIEEALSAIRIALLEADVALPVVKEFIEKTKAKALGQEVLASLRPGDVLVKIVHDELVELLGADSVPLNLKTTPPAVVMVVGLQGSGKTTTVAKLAKHLHEVQSKKVFLASADIYRPAAIEQLKLLAEKIAVPFYTSASNDAVVIADGALHEARINQSDVVLLDTAGRLHIDENMMAELQRIHAKIQPIETLLVVDSMTGQDAANVAKSFTTWLPITGVILTKADGDARGGAALSMRMIAGQPIKFVGVGEKLDALELFHPDRLASRILGMGDIVGLVEETQQKVDMVKAEKLAKKIRKGREFDFEDFKEQLQQMRSMGGLSGLISKLPGINLPANAQNMLDDKLLVKMEAIIDSMTLRERRFPAVIKGSNKQRIAGGSGTEVQDVNRMLKQFLHMQKMMKKLKGGKMADMMRRLQGAF